MADWSPLRERLRLIDDEVTIDWSELDALVGGLPRSAYDYRPFWAGDRSTWRGFRTTGVLVGKSVTFIRVPADSVMPAAELDVADLAPVGPSDVVLVGCGKTKLDHPAAARDLYTSSLFRKSRAYAERSGQPWYVVSAEHGLVDPSTTLTPYDLQLGTTSRSYRRAWGEQVVESLSSVIGPLAGLTVEIHAGRVYVDALRAPLLSRGAVVLEPLRGLRQGQRLQWYVKLNVMTAEDPQDPTIDVDQLAVHLADHDRAQRPDELDRQRLSAPGLYSWWVDQAGAADLQQGLGHPVSPGLIYAGLAGTATNTLWGRITGMHLGKRHSFSTLRRSLGSVLAEVRGDPEIDEEALTSWMHEHLRVVTLPMADASTLDALETHVLERLDPPLNLAKMTKTPLRAQLSVLRKRHST